MIVIMFYSIIIIVVIIRALASGSFATRLGRFVYSNQKGCRRVEPTETHWKSTSTVQYPLSTAVVKNKNYDTKL